MTDPSIHANVSADIRALRTQSNNAIAARDPERIVALMMPDVAVNVAGGPVLRGQEASRAAFADQFADRNFRGYVRDVDTVELGADPTVATERGRWTGRWRKAAGDHEMHGTYVAEWRLTDVGWRIQSETFVTTQWNAPH